ncbi:MAG: putative endolysin type Endo-N-acetylmuramidase [Prokaryotic dsDNA virus sp.]|nr:MAG: putative endolysin type Endo-N-acetylmuramidase [Prokaryotic dsDNA virus sp.]|tara:strand:- start:1327 stop:2166 length:840 start_codon:yes stop_codon:yes gene_type:complete
MSLRYTLRKGDEGQEVKRLQSKLPTSADGKFGPKTEKAVRDYQQHNGLTVDGLAGKQTLSSLGINVTPAVDLSSWNGTVDFKKLKQAGVSHAWIKLTEGTTHRNPGYQKKFDTARNEGVIVGGYHFGRPDTYSGDPNDWEKEANNFLLQLDKAGCHKGDLVPVLDLEKGMKTDDNHNVEWCLKWLQMVGKETNSTPLIYSARWAWQLFVMKAAKDKQQELAQYPLWLASYNEGIEPKRKTKLWKKWAVWQFTGHGTIEGVKGRCDLNWIAGEQLAKLTV